MTTAPPPPRRIPPLTPGLAQAADRLVDACATAFEAALDDLTRHRIATRDATPGALTPHERDALAAFDRAWPHDLDPRQRARWCRILEPLGVAVERGGTLAVDLSRLCALAAPEPAPCDASWAGRGAEPRARDGARLRAGLALAGAPASADPGLWPPTDARAWLDALLAALPVEAPWQDLPWSLARRRALQALDAAAGPGLPGGGAPSSVAARLRAALARAPLSTSTSTSAEPGGGVVLWLLDDVDAVLPVPAREPGWRLLRVDRAMLDDEAMCRALLGPVSWAVPVERLAAVVARLPSPSQERLLSVVPREGEPVQWREVMAWVDAALPGGGEVGVGVEAALRERLCREAGIEPGWTGGSDDEVLVAPLLGCAGSPPWDRLLRMGAERDVAARVERIWGGGEWLGFDAPGEGDLPRWWVTALRWMGRGVPGVLAEALPREAAAPLSELLAATLTPAAAESARLRADRSPMSSTAAGMNEGIGEAFGADTHSPADPFR